MDSASTQFPFQDLLGSTRLVVDYDAGGSCPTTPYCPVYEAAWKPFGVEVPLNGDSEEKYLGKRAPDEAGLYWFGARYYDPEIGRFTSLDPILGSLSVPQTLNRYAYATNDPVGLSDPEGASLPSSSPP